MNHKNDKPLWSELDWITNYKIPEPINTSPDWETCKLLGSFLETSKDVNRRKQLSLNTFNNIRYIFESNILSTELKLRTFNTYISSIFLYNSEIWTVTPTIEHQIDSFHRRLLRNVLNIKWPKKISNNNLYIITNTEKWSKTVTRRRLNWLGHLMRLDTETPARKALTEFLTPSKHPRGRPKATWLSIIKTDLQKININLDLKNK